MPSPGKRTSSSVTSAIFASVRAGILKDDQCPMYNEISGPPHIFSNLVPWCPTTTALYVGSYPTYPAHREFIEGKSGLERVPTVLRNYTVPS